MATKISAYFMYLVSGLGITLGSALGVLSLPVGVLGADQDCMCVSGRLLVKPKPGLSEVEFAKILKSHGGKMAGKIDAIGVHIVQLPQQASEKAVAALLSKNPHLEFAERDLILKPDAMANDPYFVSGWHLSTIGASTAWDGSTGQNIVVAILDSGVDGTHPDLAGQVLPGWNFFDNNSDSSDVNGHGTKVAGTVSALTNNALGVSSVAWAARILPIRISDLSGNGSVSAMASGITWAADKGARAANLSYAAAGSGTIQSAGQYLKSKGGLLVVSAGNYGTLTTAAASDTLISVSATDGTDSRASWSSYGSDVDLAAPGVGIWTTVRGGGYGAVSGTSFSAPITAGVVALMMSANPTLTPDKVQSLLFSTAKDLGTTGWDTYYGHGRVDAAAAVAAALSEVASDTTSPTVSITSPSGGTVLKGLATVSVSASDNIGVTHVELLVNSKLIASSLISPYSFSLDTTQLPEGAATISAHAFDAAGNVSSRSINVMIANSADTTAPTVFIASPFNQAVLTGSTVTVKASGTDNVSVSMMSLYFDGKLMTTTSAASLSYKLNLRKVPAGTHTLKVEAKDAAGNIGSQSIQVSK